MKKYLVYMDDGHNCFKLAIPADSVKAAKKYVSGNGEIIKVTDVTEDYPISVEKVGETLLKAGFGEYETDFITRALTQINIAE